MYIYILCMPYSVSTYRISYIPVLYPSHSKNNIKPNCLKEYRKINQKQNNVFLHSLPLLPLPSQKKPSGPRQRHRPLEIPSSKIQGDWRMDRLPINQAPGEESSEKIVRTFKIFMSEATFPPIIINIINNIIIIIFTIIIWRSPNISHIATSSSP